MIDVFVQKLKKEKEIYLNLKIKAGAKETKFKEILPGDILKINIKSNPQKGKANQELISFLAKNFSVPKSNIQILKGQTNQNKLVKIYLI